jgi:Flp pilus assembly protein TadG
MRDDRGAALIQVELGLMALMAFSTFVMDYGVYFTSRRQAQNAADAAAMAGVVALAYDSPSDLSATSASVYSALQEGLRNPVWGQSPSVLATDVTFPTSPSVCTDAGGTAHFCVRVNVYRTAARGNALPIFFGTFAGLTSQDVQATATAALSTANASNCLKPWAVSDLFTDANHNGIFDPGSDTYVAPSTSTPGTGYSVTNNYGAETLLKMGSDDTRLSNGWFLLTAIGGGGGGDTYENAIEGCVGQEYGIGDDLPRENGNKGGPTDDGVTYIIDQDRNAYWDPTANGGRGAIAGSCAPGACGTQSPRIVAVPVFDPAKFEATGEIKVVNIFGFFVESLGDNHSVTGRLVNVPALFDASKGSIGASSSFLRSIQLVR